MERRMTYKKLMQKVEDGYAEILAWTTTNNPAFADVLFYKSNGEAKREIVEVTGIPADLQP